MYGRYLAWILEILMNNRLASQLAHTHNVIGMIHSILFNGIYSGIHITTATVEVSGMHMDY